MEKFTVNKVGLGNRDLGVYLAGELGEVANSEISRLKNSQKAEKERGATKIVKTTNYSGLIGITLDLKNKILPGYEPVVTPLVIDIVQQVIVEPEPEPELEPEPDLEPVSGSRPASSHMLCSKSNSSIACQSLRYTGSSENRQ